MSSGLPEIMQVEVFRRVMLLFCNGKKLQFVKLAHSYNRQLYM
jgi:hypothetical protein